VNVEIGTEAAQFFFWKFQIFFTVSLLCVADWNLGLIETPGWSWIGVYSTAFRTRLTTIKLEDFFLTSQFPDFLTQPVGGFINNILRGLLLIRIN
jgi:hypothetical protein